MLKKANIEKATFQSDSKNLVDQIRKGTNGQSFGLNYLLEKIRILLKGQNYTFKHLRRK